MLRKTTNFSCAASESDSGITGTLEETTQRRITLCQLGEGGNNVSAWSGGLVSEFRPVVPVNLSLPDAGFEASTLWGAAYLVLNVTNGTWIEWAGATDTPQTPQAYEERDSWLDLIFANGNLVLSVTLCYTSFMTADLPTKISSPTNRTEPNPEYDFVKSKYTYATIRNLLGQNSTFTQSQRGILKLESQRDSWLANSPEFPPVEPYIRDFANMGGPEGAGNSGNYSASLWNGQAPSTGTLPPSMFWLTPERTFIWLFQEIVTNGGSVAFGLQSLYKILAGIAYYDQLGQFDNTDMSKVSEFVTVNAPLHWRGWLATVIALFVHAMLMTVICTFFWIRCKHTYIRQTWKTLSQTVTTVTTPLLEMAATMDDSEIKEELKKAGQKNIRVEIKMKTETGIPGVVESIYEPLGGKELNHDAAEATRLVDQRT